MRSCAYVVCLAFIASVGTLNINRSARLNTKKNLIGTIEPRNIGEEIHNLIGGTENDNKSDNGTDNGANNGTKIGTNNGTDNGTDTATLIELTVAEESFLRGMLELINKYRQLHAAPPLVLSLNLTEAATKWVTKLANEDQELLDVNAKYGQTIFSTKETGNMVNRAVESWYNQIRNYDFHSPRETLKATYFTQLVWVKSREVGIAQRKSNSSKTYVVVLYNPPGNEGNFLHNVLPVTGSGVGKSGPSSCTDGYKFFDNSCYKYFPGPRNWLQATERCTEQFASLTSIEGSGQDFFIRSILTARQAAEAWIGLSDVSNPGTLSWLDGTQHIYGNYDTTQGNVHGRKCGVTSTQTNWKYKACDGSRGFVCRRRLRGETTYEVVIRYINKLWTDSLTNTTSHRYQALSKHLEAEILDVYNDDDWFDTVAVDHFSKSEGKILAFIKLSFTPDDDSPPDPIQKLREKIEEGTPSRTKRALTKGVLHGEEVELLKVTMVIEEKSCPNYCVSNECAPQACSPWCCDAYGQQYYQGANQQQQSQQQQPQPQQQQPQQQQQLCGSYPNTQSQACNQQQQYPYQPVIRPQYQYQTTGQNALGNQVLNRPDKKSNRTNGGQAAERTNPQALAVAQAYPGIAQHAYYQSVGQPQLSPATMPFYAPMPYPNHIPPSQGMRVEVSKPMIAVGSSPMNGQLPSQYPNQMPHVNPNQYPPQVYNPNLQMYTRLFDPAARSRVRYHSHRRGKTEKHDKEGSSPHIPQPPIPGIYPAGYQGAYPVGYRGAYPAGYAGAYPARYPYVYPPSYPRPYAMPYPRIYPAGHANAYARVLPRPNDMQFHKPPPQPVPVTVAKLIEPTTCPPPCPNTCAPECTDECCKDR